MMILIMIIITIIIITTIIITIIIKTIIILIIIIIIILVIISNNNINSKEYLGDVFRPAKKLALRTCSAVPCFSNSVRRSY